MTSIGSLNAQVTADASQLKRELANAGKSAKSFSDTTRVAAREAERALERVSPAVLGTQRSFKSAAASARVFERQVGGRAAGSTRKFGAIATQAGFQVGDFATQVGNGTSGFVAFGQQVPQFLGAFGAVGAVAGATIAILAPLAGKFFEARDGVQEAGQAAKDLTADLMQLNRTVLELTGNEAALSQLRKSEQVRQASQLTLDLANAEIDRLRNVQEEERKLARLREKLARARERDNLGGVTGLTAGLGQARGQAGPAERAIEAQVRQQQLALTVAQDALRRDRDRLAVARSKLEVIKETAAAEFGGAGRSSSSANDNRAKVNDNRLKALGSKAANGLAAVQSREGSPYQQRLRQLEDFQSLERQQILAAADFALISNDRKNELLLQSDQRYAEAKKSLDRQTAMAAISMAQTSTAGSLDSLKKLGLEGSAIYKTMFLANQAAAIGNASINTAEGVTKALASAPPPVNFALAASVGAAGALQVAAIGAQTIQGFEKGGLVAGGRRLIEVNEAGEEFVMNASATRRHLPMLQAMNQDALMPTPSGGGVTVVKLGDAEAKRALGHLQGKLVRIEASETAKRRRDYTTGRMARAG